MEFGASCSVRSSWPRGNNAGSQAVDHVTHSHARAYLLTRRRVAGEAAFSLDTTTTIGSWCLCTLLHILILTCSNMYLRRLGRAVPV
jgi:hypothetical protein